MNVTVFLQRAVSTTYTVAVGSDEASDSVMIWPNADHVKRDLDLAYCLLLFRTTIFGITKYRWIFGRVKDYQN